MAASEVTNNIHIYKFNHIHDSIVQQNLQNKNCNEKEKRLMSYPKQKELTFLNFKLRIILLYMMQKPRVDFFIELQSFPIFEILGTSFNSAFILIYVNKFL